MAIESKLEAARRKGDLVGAIGALREEARTTETDTAPGREELNEVDGAIRLASHLAATGTKKGPERREAMRDVRPGVTVGVKGVVKTKPTRAQTFARTKGWAVSLTDQEREAFMTGERYAALSESAQDLIADVFAEVENDAFSTTEADVPVANIVEAAEAEVPDVDELVRDEDEEDEVEFDESMDIDALVEQAGWEAGSA
jgi:hypothetical protein